MAAEPGQTPAASANTTDVPLPNLGVINLAPDSENQVVSTPVDTALPGSITLQDPDNDQVSIASVTFNGQSFSAVGGTFTVQDTYGELVLESDGTYTYTPNPNATGSDVFSIELQDIHGGTSTSTVTVNVGITRSLAFGPEDGDNALPDQDALLASAFDLDTEYEEMLIPENNDWVEKLGEQTGPEPLFRLDETASLSDPSGEQNQQASGLPVVANDETYDLSAALTDIDIFEPLEYASTLPGISFETDHPVFTDLALETGNDFSTPQTFIDDMMLAETIKMLAAG